MARTLFVEIRSYNLKPGTRSALHALITEQGLPMLRRWNVDVVAYGPSLHDEDSYFLIRAYSSVEERQRSQEAFYGSAEWRQGPRNGDDLREARDFDRGQRDRYLSSRRSGVQSFQAFRAARWRLGSPESKPLGSHPREFPRPGTCDRSPRFPTVAKIEILRLTRLVSSRHGRAAPTPRPSG